MTDEHTADFGRLIVQGPDRPGIVASVSRVLSEHGANIVSLAQSSSEVSGGRFFQRTVFHLPGLAVKLDALRESLAATVETEQGLVFRLVEARLRKRVAIFVSRTDHCLLDLLWRQRRGEIAMTVPMVISNHPDLADDVRQLGIPYFHVPVDGATRAEAEREHLKLLTGNVELVVLARYMQILSPEFLDAADVPVINIHHSFLPAFVGPNPYQRAREQGVKLIGATAHYVTEELDEGPIIEQDVIRVQHHESVLELQRKGADVERLVLSRAVSWHCDDRVIRDGNTTVVL